MSLEFITPELDEQSRILMESIEKNIQEQVTRQHKYIEEKLRVHIVSIVKEAIMELKRDGVL